MFWSVSVRIWSRNSEFVAETQNQSFPCAEVSQHELDSGQYGTNLQRSLRERSKGRNPSGRLLLEVFGSARKRITDIWILSYLAFPDSTVHLVSKNFRQKFFKRGYFHFRTRISDVSKPSNYGFGRRQARFEISRNLWRNIFILFSTTSIW